MLAWVMSLAVEASILAGAPMGWLASAKPGEFDVALDDREAHDGRRSLRLQAISPRAGVGYVTQIVHASPYRKKRVRLTAWMKTENVGYAALWLSCNDDKYNVINSDVMYDRPVSGSTPFSRYELVIDVPANAIDVRFGAKLDGTGKIWIDDFKLEEVSTQVALTGKPWGNDAPANLSFEQ
jgi:hypothetical protein